MSDPAFFDLLEQSRAIHETKSHDYASAADPHSNFRYAETVMTPFPECYKPYAGLIGQKLARLAQLLSGKAPKHESIEDSFVDLMTYCGLMGARWKAEQHAEALRLAESRLDVDAASDAALWPDDAQWKTEEAAHVPPRSGNVFADLGLPNAEKLLVKAEAATRHGARHLQSTPTDEPGICVAKPCPHDRRWHVEGYGCTLCSGATAPKAEATTPPSPEQSC